MEGIATKHQEAVSMYQSGTTPTMMHSKKRRCRAIVHAAGNSASAAPGMPFATDVVEAKFPAINDRQPYSPPSAAEGPRKRVLCVEGHRLRKQPRQLPHADFDNIMREVSTKH